ncbi:NAD(P)H-hydrate dehydratase [Caldiplasma sukawensis]
MIDFLEEKRIDFNYYYKYRDLYPLMRNAGKAVYQVIKDLYVGGRNILIICGKGHNGGDGIVAGTFLSGENRVTILLYTKENGVVDSMIQRAMGEMKNASIIKNPSVETVNSYLKNCDLVVDALFGIGVKGDIREPFASIIDLINKSGKTVISVDVPSGLGSNKQVRPKITITFTDIKEGMDDKNSGEIIVRDIGIDRQLIENTGPGDMIYFPKLVKGGHKGENGIAGVVAGWERTGAGIISSISAAKALPDLVYSIVPEKSYDIFCQHIIDHIVVKDDPEITDKVIEKCKSLVVGPGLGTGQRQKELFYKLVDSGKSLVVDADAIHILKEDLTRINEKIIITPHGGEFRYLTGMEPTAENAKTFALQYGCTVLLKGKEDIITDGKKMLKSPGGSDRMAMGGTGDMLAGFVAGLISRGMSNFHSAALASFLLKRLGEDMEKFKAHFYSTSDMLHELDNVLYRYYNLIEEVSKV